MNWRNSLIYQDFPFDMYQQQQEKEEVQHIVEFIQELNEPHFLVQFKQKKPSFFSCELIYEEILSVPAWQVAMRENIEKINVCKLSIFQSEADSANPSTTMKR